MWYLCIYGVVVDDFVIIVYCYVYIIRDWYGGVGVEVCSVFLVFRWIEIIIFKLMDGKIYYIYVYIF